MINTDDIFKIFLDYLDCINTANSNNKLYGLIKLCIESNKKLWELEDSARMIELGPIHVSFIKHEIDNINQIRNDLIREIDTEITRQMNISASDSKSYYSESPGMIIDRLSILFIKRSAIRKLLLIFEENDLNKEYKDKIEIIDKQIKRLGDFLNIYFYKLEIGEVVFEISQPVKIYNDPRIRKYVKKPGE